MEEGEAELLTYIPHCLHHLVGLIDEMIGTVKHVMTPEIAVNNKHQCIFL